MVSCIGSCNKEVKTGIMMNPPPTPINPHKNPVKRLIGMSCRGLWCLLLNDSGLEKGFSKRNDDKNKVRAKVSKISWWLERV